MARPPHGVTPDEWQAARREAALAEIEMLKAAGKGFYPAKIIEAFEAGLCDTSGNVASFLTEDQEYG